MLVVMAFLTLAACGGDEKEKASPTPTPDPLQAALARAQDFSGSNGDWDPFVQAFDDVAMALVPAGCFEIGSEDGGRDERPVHRVCFEEPFWIDRTEVTNGQFAAFNGQAASSSAFSGDNRPREQITWTEAQAFCESRGARLPSEAEWEYAARGPDRLTYPWGDEFVSDNAIWDENSGGQTAEVGSLPAGVSWVGTFDMSGNVWEWVADWYSDTYYSSSPSRNPTGPSTGSYRVLRGGSWLVINYIARSSYRGNNYPDSTDLEFGFRCARSE